MNQLKHPLIAILCVGLIFCTSACTPTQESQVLNDIDAVVNLAGSVLSVVQSFGKLDSPQAKQDVASAEELAQQYSAASSAAITEFNSMDSWDQKVVKITELFDGVASIPGIQTPQINAAVQVLTAAVKLLLSQLNAAAPAPTAGASFKVAGAETEARTVSDIAAGVLPGTMHHRLKSIQNKADKNVALAGRLKAAIHASK